MVGEALTARTLLAALRKKHANDAVVREVVIDDPFDAAYRYRERIDRYASQGWADLARHELTRAEQRGIEIPDALPDGWSLSSSTPQRRIDALIIASTGITAVEIKISRADFRRDTDVKRRAWRAVTNRFIYLVPRGLVAPDEVADGCGLWEYDPQQAGPYRSQHGITATKRAKPNKTPAPLPFQVTRALAYRVSANEYKEER